MCSSPPHEASAQRSSHCLAHHNCHWSSSSLFQHHNCRCCMSSLAHWLSLHCSPGVLSELLQHLKYFPWLESLSPRFWWISLHPLHSCCQHSLDHDLPHLSGLSGQCEIFQCASSATLQPQTLCHRLCRGRPPPLWASHSISACETSSLSPSRRPCRCSRCTGRFCLGALIVTGNNETCKKTKYATKPRYRRCST